MEPRLDTFSEGQKRLWPELASTPDHFTLYGGSAIALRLNHRPSIDFDFFSSRRFDPEALYREVAYLQDAEVLQIAPDTLTCSVHRAEPVKVSFFGVPTLGRVEEPEVASGPNIRVASLLDLAGTKAAVIQKRAASRDYLDLDAILSQGPLDLLTVLAAGRVIYGPMFNPQIALKALSYYGDGDLARVPREVQHRLVQAVRSVDLEALAARVRELGGPR